MMDMRHTVNEAVALQKIGTAKAVPILANAPSQTYSCIG